MTTDVAAVATDSIQDGNAVDTNSTAAPAPWPGLDAPLEVANPEVAEYIGRELRRQQDTLEMIASENFASVATMQAQGSVLTNKYAEGYPAAGTTAAARTSTSSNSRSSTAKACSAPGSPTCSHIPVPRPTPPPGRADQAGGQDARPFDSRTAGT